MASWHNLASMPNACNAEKVLYDNKHNRLLMIQQEKLFQYSFITDSWIKYKMQSSETETHLQMSHNFAAAINNEGDTIYLCHQTGRITIFELKNDNEYEIKIIGNLHYIKWQTKYGSGVMINDEFHIIGGYANPQHIKYIIQEAKCDVVHDLRASVKLNGICYNAKCKIKDKLLLFGGYDGYKDMDSIHQYDILNDQWTKLQSKLPKPLAFMTATPILSGQLILLFGGNSGPDEKDLDEIHIYSVRDGTFKESSVKCPRKGEHQAITVNNKEKDQLIVFGYVRSKWSECGMDNHLFPPEYLIKIIGSYYLNEFVHLFNHEGEHYRINVFDLVN